MGRFRQVVQFTFLLIAILASCETLHVRIVVSPATDPRVSEALQNNDYIHSGKFNFNYQIFNAKQSSEIEISVFDSNRIDIIIDATNLIELGFAIA
jgi:hypothetical protein